MSGTDLFDKWLAHYEGKPLAPEEDLPEPPIPEPHAEPHAEPHVAEARGEPRPTADPRPITGFTSDGLAARLPEPEPLPEPEALPATWFFKPRTGTRRILGFVLLAWLISCLCIGAWACQDRSWTGFGLAATMFALTAVTWAVRAGTTVAILTVRGGQLEIQTGGTTVMFDLAAPHTPIEVHGEPGRRDWKVCFLRRNLEPYVVDELMVDPHEFMRVLRAYRPGA